MNFSSYFASSSGAFLNAGSLARAPLEILDLMMEKRREEEANPTLSVFKGPGNIWRSQESLARTFHGEAEDFFLRSNVTQVLNDILYALELPAGAEIITTDLEYGATLNILKKRVKDWKGSLRTLEIPLGPQVDHDLILEVFEKNWGKAKLLMVSHIATGTGTIFPLKEIVALAKKRGTLVVVDGAHGPGALSFDLSSIQPDFYGGNLHKWYMAPRGTAFGWMNPAFKENLDWKFGGWASFGKPLLYQEYAGSDASAQRTLSGTMDLTPFQMIPEMENRFWKKWENEARETQRNRRDQCALLLENLGYQKLSSRVKEVLGPLVAFSLPEEWPKTDPSQWLTSLWEEAKVQVHFPVVKGKICLRLSPGCYTRSEEVERGVAALEKWRRKYA